MHNGARMAIPNSFDILHAVIEATLDAIFVKDLEGRYVLVNEAFCRFIGKTHEEIVGRNDYELYSEADARAFIGRETRRFDVIFLDPPFRSDPWEWLLPACAERLAPGGYLYAEAAHPIQPPSVLAAWRSDRAGQVHYHLFARSAAPT